MLIFRNVLNKDKIKYVTSPQKKECMKKEIAFSCFLIGILLGGCQTPPPKKALLTFENQRFEKIYGNCEDKEGDCLHILLDYD